jgi:tryptophan 2,3-dioxygenase
MMMPPPEAMIAVWASLEEAVLCWEPRTVASVLRVMGFRWGTAV